MPSAMLQTLEPGTKRLGPNPPSIGARSARTLIIRLRAIGEGRVAEAGPDGQDPPVLDVLHNRHLAQTLHHGVVVHEHDRLVSADLGNGSTQWRGEGAAVALSVAGLFMW